MSCGGGHLGFPIHIKNKKLVKDISMIVHHFLWNHLDNLNQTAQEWSLEGPLQNWVLYADWKSKMAATAGNRLTLDPIGKWSSILYRNKKPKFLEDHPMNIHVQFGFNHICSFWEEGIVPWMVLYKVSVFRSSRIFNMAARTYNMLWLAEISKILFSETNELTEPKL
jgi:hypothetical protein